MHVTGEGLAGQAEGEAVEVVFVVLPGFVGFAFFDDAEVCRSEEGAQALGELPDSREAEPGSSGWPFRVEHILDGESVAREALFGDVEHDDAFRAQGGVRRFSEDFHDLIRTARVFLLITGEGD